jgi:hypothetical protein
MRVSFGLSWLAAAAFGLAGAAIAADPGGCADVTGEYENRSSDASGSEIYLSDILGIEPGVSRVIFLPRPDGMVLRAPRHDSAVYERFLPWAEFWCEGNERVLGYSRSNAVLTPHEGKPLGGSSDRRVAFAKAGDGALLVKYSLSGSWFAPVLWGTMVSDISGGGWARFEAYKRQ